MECFFELRDEFAILYCIPNIRYKLLESAKSGNARAYFHLGQSLSIHVEVDDQLKRASKKLISKAKELADDDLVLLHWVAPFKEKRQILEQKSFSNDKREGERLYYLAGLLDNSEEAMKCLIEASRKGFKSALVEIARRQKTNELRFENYIKAGEAGAPDGYFYAAVMLNEGKVESKQDAPSLWRKAMNLGQIQSSEELIKYYLAKGDEINAKKIAEDMPERDMSGFVILGNYYLAKENVELAKKLFLQAGPFYGFLNASKLEAKRKAANQLISNAFNQKYNHFKSIVEQLI